MFNEAPGSWIPEIRQCDQHAMRSWLTRRFVANAPPVDIIPVETMRRGIGVAAPAW